MWSLLLLDEPFSNLDALLRVRLREELRRIQRQTPITAIFVTHDQEEALSLADRIAVMAQGNVDQIDRPSTTYAHPQTLFVADFIGTMNMFPATLRPDQLWFGADPAYALPAPAAMPAHSLAGIAAAARLGADAVEIDLRCTRDGVAVAAHDAALRDAAGHTLPISALTAAELRTAALASGSDMPTLDAVIAHCYALRLGLYLELKDEAAIAPMLVCLTAHACAEFTIVGAFRPDWLADLKVRAPELTTSVLFNAPEIDAVALAAACGAQYIHPCWERRGPRPDDLLTPAWLARARQADLGIIAWHEERPDVIAGLRQHGIDGLCSDQQELLR